MVRTIFSYFGFYRKLAKLGVTDRNKEEDKEVEDKEVVEDTKVVEDKSKWMTRCYYLQVSS